MGYIEIEKEVYEEIEKQQATQKWASFAEFYEENKKYLDLPDDQLKALTNFVYISKGFGHEMTVSKWKEFSKETIYHLMDLHNELRDQGQIGIMVCESKDTDDWYVSSGRVRRFINQIKEKKQSIGERLQEQLRNDAELGGYHEAEIGNVILRPLYGADQKILGVTVQNRNEYYWSVEDIRRLGEELISLAAYEGMQDFFNKENNELRQREEQAKERRRIEKEEIDNYKWEPKSGCVVLYQAFPSGKYKFTYSYKLSLIHI